MNELGLPPPFDDECLDHSGPFALVAENTGFELQNLENVAQQEEEEMEVSSDATEESELEDEPGVAYSASCVPKNTRVIKQKKGKTDSGLVAKQKLKSMRLKKYTTERTQGVKVQDAEIFEHLPARSLSKSAIQVKSVLLAAEPVDQRPPVNIVTEDTSSGFGKFGVTEQQEALSGATKDNCIDVTSSSTGFVDRRTIIQNRIPENGWPNLPAYSYLIDTKFDMHVMRLLHVSLEISGKSRGNKLFQYIFVAVFPEEHACQLL
jgi:hypothetical protein